MNPDIRQKQHTIAKRRVLAAEHPRERLALRLLLGTLVALILLYIYFVSATTLNVIARKDAMRRTDGMTSAIGALEQQYFALARGVTPEAASELGLVPVAHTAYVYRPGSVGIAVTQGSM